MTDIVCSICFDKINSSDIKITNCMHKFHEICLDRWIEEKNKSFSTPTCPECRTQLNESNNYEELDDFAMLLAREAKEAIEENRLRGPQPSSFTRYSEEEPVHEAEESDCTIEDQLFGVFASYYDMRIQRSRVITELLTLIDLRRNNSATP